LQRIGVQSRELLEAAKISDADVGKLLNAIEYLYLYLNDRYVHLKESKEEIISMLSKLFSDQCLDAIMRAEKAEQ
jgi:hemerythrin-like domain-containing protein